MRKHIFGLLTAASAFSLTAGYADCTDADDKENAPCTNTESCAEDCSEQCAGGNAEGGQEAS